MRHHGIEPGADPGGTLSYPVWRSLAMNPRLRISHEALARFCRDHAVRQLALFGSAVREDFEETSDVDVLIDLRPDARVGLVTLQRMSDELAGIFGPLSTW